jgi:hypothetical protein
MSTKTKTPKNASVTAQKAWAAMPKKLKAELKKNLPNQDRDKVPTGFDCRPLDPKKQESFLPADAKYVNDHRVVKKGSKALGEGTNGYVYPVKDTGRMILKVGKSSAWNDLKTEASFHKRHNMTKLPLMTPMKEVKTSTGQYAVLKPVVIPVVEPGNVVRSKAVFTDSRLRTLRAKIIELSYRGYIFSDGFQLGVDKAGRLLQFDTGAMQHITQSKHHINNRPFMQNNEEWQGLLANLGKRLSDFGEIKRSSVLDKKYFPPSTGQHVLKTKSPTKQRSGSIPRPKQKKSSSNSCR